MTWKAPPVPSSTGARASPVPLLQRTVGASAAANEPQVYLLRCGMD